MVKIVLFNGPPRSGKDTCSQMALEHLGKNAVHYRFAAPLKDSVHGLFGMGAIKQEHFDVVKDDPSDIFFGMTPREAYIWMSEDVVKPRFGKDFFAKVAVNAIHNVDAGKTVVISDCGFYDEVKLLVQTFGIKNVALVFLKRDGCAFKTGVVKDSRAYVTDVLCQQFTVENDGSFNDLNKQVVAVLDKFLTKN